MGGKYFLSKEISSIMKNLVDVSSVNGYLEPFCGACSVLVRMNDNYDCYASDYHPDLIELWKDIQNNTFIFPDKMTEEIYNDIKKLKSPNSLKGFVGFGCSFGGKFFSGYADKYKNNKKENFLQEAINSINKKKDKLDNINFTCCSYDEWNPNNMLIYCDPPYQNTKYPIKYRRGVKDYDIFDNIKFWNVMREWSKNNIVFISETSAPEDFYKVWTKKTHRSASQSEKTRYKNSSDSFKDECLYVHNSLLEKINLG